MPKEWEERLEQLGKTQPSRRSRPARSRDESSVGADPPRRQTGLLSSGNAAAVREHSLRPLVILAAVQTFVLLVTIILIARFAGVL